MKKDRGFSLLELLIVVAIILIIATIAIPSLLVSRQAANEAAAVSTLKTVNTAQVTYLSSSGGNFGSVASLVNAGLLDTRFNGTVQGYVYTITTAGYDYTATAEPVAPNAGRYGYYSTPDGVIRFSMAATLAPEGKAGVPVQ